MFTINISGLQELQDLAASVKTGRRRASTSVSRYVGKTARTYRTYLREFAPRGQTGQLRKNLNVEISGNMPHWVIKTVSPLPQAVWTARGTLDSETVGKEFFAVEYGHKVFKVSHPGPNSFVKPGQKFSHFIWQGQKPKDYDHLAAIFTIGSSPEQTADLQKLADLLFGIK